MRIGLTIGTAALLAIGCGTSDSPIAPDAAPPAVIVDAGAPDTDPPPDPSYPAAHPGLPLVDYNGGGILDAPEIVTITFADDPLDARIKAFADVVGKTKWWDAVRAGYCMPNGGPCVGAAKHVAHVVLPSLDPNAAQVGFDDGADDSSPVKEFLRSAIARDLLPPPGPNTLYMLFVAQDVPIRYYGSFRACVDFTGYHGSAFVVPEASTASNGDDAGAASSTDAGPPAQFAYAVLPRCSLDDALLTRSASHELIESATDPFPVGTTEGYYMADPVWSEFLGGGEVGDLCVNVFGGETDSIVEQGFTLQRSWSNDAVKAKRDPCVPAPDGDVYFNAAPPANQLHIAVGTSATIELDAFSEAPVDDWNVTATDVLASAGLGQYLRLTIDRKEANNGTKLFLKIQVLGPTPPASVLGAPMVIKSTSGKKSHSWPMSIVPI